MKKNPQLQFTPEQELLLWSIRVDYTKDQRIAEIISKGVDWNYVRETAIQHGIIPLLYKRLKEEMSDLVPSNELEVLRTLFMMNAVRNLRMTQQLIKVLDLFADAGIEAMPFKGPALAVQAYGDLSMRSFCDLDVFIHKKDFEIVYSLLTKNGFKPFISIDTKIKKKFVLLQKDLLFSGYGIDIEIHWRITEKFLVIPLDMREFWDRKKSISLLYREFNSLQIEDSVILLCIHGSLHLWQELKWISDLTYIIKNHPNLNWDQIFSRSEKIGVKRILITGLLLVQEFGGLIFPHEIRELIKTDLPSYNFHNKILSIFFLEKKILLTPPVYYLKLRERIRDQLNYVLHYLSYEILIPNEYDFNYISLPPTLFLFYFIIRPFRLIKEHFLTLVQYSIR